MKFRLNSFLVFLFLSLSMILYRTSNVNEREISWDALGYYIPLPATFIYDDPYMDNPQWLADVNEKRNLTDTLFMISSNDEGEPMYFFYFGMSFLYLIFFACGHFSAYLLDAPMDGFSMPYIYAMVIGGIFYTVLGLFFMRKILMHYFSEGITSIVLVLLFFGTNYCHHMSLKNLETVNVLFTLCAVILWNTIKWHQSFKLKNLIWIVLGFFMMCLVKPSEIFVILLPLFWGVYSKDSLTNKIMLIRKYSRQFLIAIPIGVILVTPQVGYWILKTGQIYYDTYKNPGIGLDIFTPHLIDVLFSYKKGWFLYTPIIIFFISGFYWMFSRNKKQFYAMFGFFILSLYIMSSWTEWWYGAAFSNRPMLSVMPVTCVAFGYFLQFLSRQRKVYQVIFGVICTWFIFLNQFQWWQLRNYILDPYRTTQEYYWATFLSTSVSEKDKELLLVYRDFTGNNSFSDYDSYSSKVWKDLNFNDESEGYSKVLGDDLYVYADQISYGELSNHYYLWVEVTFKVRADFQNIKQPFFLITTMNRREGDYGYKGFDIGKFDYVDSSNSWREIKVQYLTPEIRSPSDFLKIFIWNPNQLEFDIDDYKVTYFEEK